MTFDVRSSRFEATLSAFVELMVVYNIKKQKIVIKNCACKQRHKPAKKRAYKKFSRINNEKKDVLHYDAAEIELLHRGLLLLAQSASVQTLRKLTSPYKSFTYIHSSLIQVIR